MSAVRTCGKYLAIVAAAVVCGGVGLLFGKPRPLDYFEAADGVTAAAAVVASFSIFLVGIAVAPKLK